LDIGELSIPPLYTITVFSINLFIQDGGGDWGSITALIATVNLSFLSLSVAKLNGIDKE
jgi:hypothetical protein